MDERIAAPPPGFIRTEPFSPLPEAEIPEGFGGTDPPPGFHKPVAPPTPDQALSEAINDLPDPAEEKAGMENSAYFADTIGVGMAEAYELRDEIAKKVTGDDEIKQKTFWKKLAETVGSGHSGLQAGLIQEKLYEEAFQLSLEALSGKWNAGRYNRIMEMQQQIHALAPTEDTSFLNRVIWDVGQILPNMLGAMREGSIYGTALAPIGGIAGAPVGGVGALPGAAGAFLFGFSGGMASHSFRQMRGRSWLTLSQMRDKEGNPIPQPVVQAVSLAAGALNAAIEVLQVGQIAKTVPAVKKALQRSAGEAFDAIVKEGTLRGVIVDRVKEYGAYWSQEVLEELSQEVVDIMAERVATGMSNELTGTGFDQESFQDEIERLTETFIRSGPALLVLGGPGHVMGATQDIQALKTAKAQEIQAEAEAEGIILSEDELQKRIEEQLFGGTVFEGVVDRVETPPYWYTRQRGGSRPERIAIAKETTEVQEKTRIANGDITIGEILERDIPEEKKVSQAYTRGRRAGITEEKTRKAGIEVAARERKSLHAYITKLAVDISRPPSQSVDFFYREAIENLQADIDPHFRQRGTLATRERRRKFLERYPEGKEDMPIKLLTMLNKKSLNEMTVAELETLRDETNRLRKLGRLKKRLTLSREQSELDATLDKLTANVLKGAEVVAETKPIVRSTVEEGRLKRDYRYARAFTLTPSRIFDKLDGGAGFKGEWHETFYDDANVAENEKLRAVDARLEPGAKKRDELGISLSTLAKKKVTVEGVDYSLDEALDIYAGWKNESKRLAILYGNNITPDIANEIIGSLTKEEKALADYIIGDYESRYEDLRNAHIEYMDEDLGHEDFYTPIRRRGIDYQAMDAEQRDELLLRNHLRKGYAEKGFTISRMEIPPEFQQPIQLGLYSTWLDQVPKQEHYISYGKKIRNMHRILNDKELSAAVRQEYGEEYFKAVKNYVDRVGRPNIYKTFNRWEKASQVLRKNTAVAYLSGNLVTMGKQLPSVLLYLPDTGIENLIGSATEFYSNPIEAIKFVNDRDPQMKHRSIQRELEELKAFDSNAYERIIKKVGKTGMIGIYAMDKIATSIGWKAVYDKNIADGTSEAEAIRAAQNSTLRTQPSAHPKDIAELYASNEVLNWFTQFSNQLNKLYNITTHDIPQSFSNHEYYKGILQVSGMATTSLLIWSLSNRRLPESPEDVKDAFQDTSLNMIPLIGRDIASRSEGYANYRIPPLKALGTVGDWLKDAEWSKKPIQDWVTDTRFQKNINKSLESLAILYGIPYTGPKRVYRAINKANINELVGGRPKR